MKIVEENSVERTQGKKVSINARLKAIYIRGQRKHSADKELQSLPGGGKKLVT